jgi:hypothetical protein
MGYKDTQKQKQYQQEHYKRNRDAVYAGVKARREEARESAYKSLITGLIVNTRLWNLWFNDKAVNSSLVLLRNL